MKKKRNLLIGTFLGIIMGWAAGFLRIPLLEKNYSFWVGFMASLALVLFIACLLFVWNKHILLMRLIGKKTAAADIKTISKTYTTIWIVIALFIITGGLLSSMLMYRQNKLFEVQAQYQKEKIQEQTSSIEAIKNNNMVLLMSDFFGDVNAELNSSPDNRLSDATIARIAALTHSFEPYKYTEGDSLSVHKLSPARGQLLLTLAKLKMDTSSFNKIKRSATFGNADLRKADLSGVDLSGVDLRDANLWGANLQHTKLSGAVVRGADLSWADLSEADLKLANLNAVTLTNAKMIKADLSGAKIQYADLSGALLNESNLAGCDLLWSKLRKVNFSQTNLTEANLLRVSVEEDWLDKLKGWQIIGAEKIRATYEIMPDKFYENESIDLFYLGKKTN